MKKIALMILLNLYLGISFAAPVSLESDEGQLRFNRATAKVDFFHLVNQFEPQSNNVFCGPTTAAIVLNTIQTDLNQRPRDRSRLTAEDFKYVPDNVDISLPRYTQENVIADSVKTRAQVLGEPMQGKADYGYQARQLAALFQYHKQTVRLVVVDHQADAGKIKDDMVSNLKQRGDYLVVNYLRRAAGQNGGGHFSPVAAYDEQSDSFLILDVNPNHSPWSWIEAKKLIEAMRTFDTQENRGYMHVTSK